MPAALPAPILNYVHGTNCTKCMGTLKNCLSSVISIKQEHFKRNICALCHYKFTTMTQPINNVSVRTHSKENTRIEWHLQNNSWKAVHVFGFCHFFFLGGGGLLTLARLVWGSFIKRFPSTKKCSIVLAFHRRGAWGVKNYFVNAWIDKPSS